MQKRVGRVGAMLAGLAVAALVSGCGGGSDSTIAPVPPTAVPENLAITVPAVAESTTAVAFGNSAGALAGLRYQWDFGDGATSTDAAPSHAFANGGEYDVVLKVSNEAGSSREARTRISITNVANVRGLECTAAASAGWCWQNPRPTGNRVNTVFFLNASTGWRGGEAGEIFKTTDGGNTWTRQSTGISASILGIRFLDERIGWATGSFGALLRTTDGGSTWSVSRAGDASTSFDTSTITAIDARTVYLGRTAAIGGYYGNLLASADGGLTWRTITSAPYLITATGRFWDLQSNMVRVSADGGLSYTPLLELKVPAGFNYWDTTSFTARDDLRAAVYARSSAYDFVAQRYDYLETFQVTVDGGKTWAKQERKGSSFSGVQRLTTISADGKVLVAAANSGGQIRSNDGGLTWASLPPPTNDGYYVSYIPFGTSDILASSYTGLWLSEDGGQTWLRLNAPVGLSNPNVTGDAVRRVDANTLLLTDSQSATYLSKDKGQTWTRIVTPVDAYYSNGSVLAFADARNGFMTDVAGRSFSTQDGGLTWQPKLASFGAARTAQFVSKTTGWLVGNDFRPYKTVDGGQTWVAMPYAPGVSFLGMSFKSETLGWSQRNGGAQFAFTRDGGKTWTELALPFGVTTLRQGDSAWVAAGYSGAIYVSTDSGSTWNAAYTGTNASLGAVAFSDAGTAWVAGSDGTLLKSEDAGAHWAPVKLPAPGVTLRDIRFASAKVGWIVGDSGLILKTQDGGKTWLQQPSGTSLSLYTIQAVDINTAWITGSGGTVLATGTGGN